MIWDMAAAACTTGFCRTIAQSFCCRLSAAACRNPVDLSKAEKRSSKLKAITASVSAKRRAGSITRDVDVVYKQAFGQQIYYYFLLLSSLSFSLFSSFFPPISFLSFRLFFSFFSLVPTAVFLFFSFVPSLPPSFSAFHSTTANGREWGRREGVH